MTNGNVKPEQCEHEPVHLNREGGHVWLCGACGKQLGGPRLESDELEVLFLFIQNMRARLAKKKRKAKP